MVFPCPGAVVFARSFLAQEPRFGAGQVAQKSSFSMGFRSYVRQFFAAFFAPSPSFTAMVFPCPGAVVLRGLSAQEPRFGAGQVAQKSSFSMGFRSYVRQFFAAFFVPSPSFTAMVFPCPGAVVLRGLSSPKNRVLERDK